jgi:hypothetical protein
MRVSVRLAQMCFEDSIDSECMKNLYEILRELAQQNNNVVKEMDTEQNETKSPQTSKADAAHLYGVHDAATIRGRRAAIHSSSETRLRDYSQRTLGAEQERASLGQRMRQTAACFVASFSYAQGAKPGCEGEAAVYWRCASELPKTAHSWIFIQSRNGPKQVVRCFFRSR